MEVQVKTWTSYPNVEDCLKTVQQLTGGRPKRSGGSVATSIFVHLFRTGLVSSSIAMGFRKSYTLLN